VNKTCVLLGLVLAMTARVAMAAEDELSPHLLGRWNFDGGEDGPILDTSGRNHHGRVRAVHVGATTERVDGMVGNALRLQAGHGMEVLVQRHPALNPTSGLTITAWIKYQGPIGVTGEIVGKKGLAKYIVDGYRFYVSPVGKLCLEIGDGSAVSRVQTARRTIRPNTWYFVAATFSPGHGRLYLNGRLLLDEEIVAQKIAPSNNHLVIGNFAGRRNAAPFNGLIDEVNLLDAALDGEAIFRLARPADIRQ